MLFHSKEDLIQHYAYSSFGKILKISDTNGIDITANPTVKTIYGFTNREHDAESGMMYLRALFYMPEIGRFIQEDLHPGVQTIPSTLLSKYIYVANNPQKYRDPTGKIFDPIIFTIVGAVIGGVSGVVKNFEDGGNWFEDVLGNAFFVRLRGLF